MDARQEEIDKLTPLIEAVMCCGDCNMGNTIEDCVTKEASIVAEYLVDRGIRSAYGFQLKYENKLIDGVGFDMAVGIVPINYKQEEGNK